jgi:zinc protease
MVFRIACDQYRGAAGDQVLNVFLKLETGLKASIGASYFAIKMLPEGTNWQTSQEISEAFDKIGAFTEMTHTSDRIGIVVYCLSRFLPEVLPQISQLIQHAAFPEKEFQELRNITIQNLRVSKEKNAYLATTEFRARLFGTGPSLWPEPGRK